MTDLADLSLVEAADAVRHGQATSLELLDALLGEPGGRQPAAERDDLAGSRGRRSSRAAADKAVREKAWLGPLHGVPLAHKDMYYQAGKLSTCGSAIRADFRPGDHRDGDRAS